MFAGCRCPQCDQTLALGGVGGRKVLQCSGCKGAFTNAALGLRILEALDAPAPSVPQNAPRSCPVCRRAMPRTSAAKQDVDVCRAHGAWFTAGSLPKLASAVAESLGKPAPVHVSSTATPQVVLTTPPAPAREPNRDSAFITDLSDAIEAEEGGGVIDSLLAFEDWFD